MTEIHIREPPTASASTQRVKTPPKKSSLSVPFFYAPSDDGTDENLLILLHGLGDTHIPFTNLGRQLKLPQTAILALRAPEQVPFLYEESYQWYKSFDDLGEIIERPNPTPALDLLSKVLGHLTNDCGWPSHRIHFFGFAQGGSVAAEFGIAWWKKEVGLRASASGGTAMSTFLGSIVTVSAPLLSYPTLSTLSPTPVLVVHDSASAETSLPPGAVTAYKKAYQNVVEAKKKNPGMPSSKEGWEPIMRFWAMHLGRRQVEGLYEIMSGVSPAS